MRAIRRRLLWLLLFGLFGLVMVGCYAEGYRAGWRDAKSQAMCRYSPSGECASWPPGPRY